MVHSSLYPREIYWQYPMNQKQLYADLNYLKQCCKVEWVIIPLQQSQKFVKFYIYPLSQANA